jgi:hypothetical protein
VQQCKACDVRPSVDECSARVEGILADGRVRVTFETKRERYESVLLGLRGRHQVTNVSVAIRLAESLATSGFAIDRSAIIEGIETASHAGRLEFCEGRPSFLFDGAHNPSGARALREYLDEFVRVPLTLVFGVMRDKDIEEMAQILFPAANRLILTQPDNPRAATVEMLEHIASRLLNAEKISPASSVSDAIHIAQELTPATGVICVSGSLYLIGEVQAKMGRWQEKVAKKHSRTYSLVETNSMAGPEQPRILDSVEIFSGRVFAVTVDTIREGETTYQREVVRHPGSAVIVPVFEDGSVALVRQYRHPAVRYLLEIPAGTLNSGERPDEGAARE